MADPPATNWFPVLTLLIGYVIKSLTDWIQDRRSIQREREAREVTRREELSERRNTFQRETLLALQDAFMQLNRATGAIHHQVTMSGEAGGRQQLPDGLSENYHAAQTRTSMLVSRVRDNRVRDLVEQIRQLSVESTMSATKRERDRALTAMMQLHDPLNQRIGEILRTLDDADAAT
jgi:hypothetical protein